LRVYVSRLILLHLQDFGLSYDVGRSMDLREQSLIQTDRSGELENIIDGADFEETADWDD